MATNNKSNKSSAATTSTEEVSLSQMVQNEVDGLNEQNEQLKAKIKENNKRLKELTKKSATSGPSKKTVEIGRAHV